METHKTILKNLQEAIIAGDEENARARASDALAAGIEPLVAVEAGIRDGLRIVGDKFERLEVFLPEMMMAADAGNAVMEVLEPAMVAAGLEAESPGTMLIGAAKGDIHTIGKNILAMLLKLAGFKVHDLGEDVPATTFLEKARELKANGIAVSALMTSTMPGQRDLVSLLNDVGERDQYIVLVGGAPVTQDWADQIGADGYSETASGGVTLSLQLLNK
jgi:trimethylamine corrinoid protein